MTERNTIDITTPPRDPPDDPWTTALRLDIDDRATKEQKAILHADPVRWHESLTSYKGDLEAEIATRREESIRNGGTAQDFFRWRADTLNTLRRIDHRIRAVKKLREETGTGTWAALPPPAVLEQHRVARNASTIAAGLAARPGSIAGVDLMLAELPRKAVEIARAIDRLASGEEP